MDGLMNRTLFKFSSYDIVSDEKIEEFIAASAVVEACIEFCNKWPHIAGFRVDACSSVAVVA